MLRVRFHFLSLSSCTLRTSRITTENIHLFIYNLASNVVMILVAPFKTGQLRYGTGDTSNCLRNPVTAGKVIKVGGTLQRYSSREPDYNILALVLEHYYARKCAHLKLLEKKHFNYRTSSSSHSCLLYCELHRSLYCQFTKTFLVERGKLFLSWLTYNFFHISQHEVT